MKRELFIQPRARLDLLEQFVYLKERGSLRLAERYLTAVHATCIQLLGSPHQGARYDSGIRSLEGMRRFPVKGFEFLIFYLPESAGIKVIRVLHGAQDIDTTLAEQEDL